MARVAHQRRTKSTRQRNTPENTGNRPYRESALSGVLRFQVLFVLLWGVGPKHTRKHNTPENTDSGNGGCLRGTVDACVFGCVAFSGGACQENRGSCGLGPQDWIPTLMIAEKEKGTSIGPSP